jgi:predicted PurR-regulated permease PerM
MIGVGTVEISPKKRRKFSLWLIGIAIACSVIILALKNIPLIKEFVGKATGIVMPLIIGFVFALIINVPMSFLEDKLFRKSKSEKSGKSRRTIAFVLSLVFIIGVIAGVVWLVIPALIEAVTVIADGVMGYVNKFSAMSREEIAELPVGKLLLNVDWDKTMKTIETFLKNQGGDIVNTAVGTVSSLVSGIYDFFIAIVFAVYILFNKEKLKAQTARLVKAWIPDNIADFSIHACRLLGKNFKNFVTGQSLEAVILGVLCMIGMFILQIPYAPMVGALVGVTAIIPVVGGFIGAFVGAFMILTVSPVKAVIFLVYILVLQQLEGNLIYPKVMGTSVNLPSMWILAAVTIGGGIAGAGGMLLAVHVASTIYILVREATEKREGKLISDKEIKSEEQT